MADLYSLLAQFTYQTVPYSVPGLGMNLVRVQFLQRGYQGNPILIEFGTGEGVEQELQNKADTRWVGLQPQILTINLMVDGSYNPQVFRTRDPFDIQVRYEQVNVSGDVSEVFFVGWLLNAGLSEPIARPPYPLTLSATCGLPLLKTRPLLDAAGRYPEGFISHRGVLMGGLSLTRTNLPLATICNLRETTDRADQTINQDIDTLQREFLPAEAFAVDNTYQSAADALQELCKAWRANLIQQAGQWVFYRVNELRGGYVPFSAFGPLAATSAYIRYPDPDTGLVIGQVIDYTTRVGETQPVRMQTTPRIQGQPVAPVVAVAQTFGQPISRLVNGSFANLTGNMPTGWKRTQESFTNITRAGTGTPADPFVLRITGAGENAVSINAPVVIGAVQTIYFTSNGTATGQPTFEVKEQPMRLTGQFRGEGIRGAKIYIAAGLNPPPPGPLSNWILLTQDGTWKANPARADLKAIEVYAFQEIAQGNPNTTSDDTAITKTGWHEVDITLPASPINIASLSIHLCQGNYLRKPGFGAIIDLGPDHTFIEYRSMKLSIGDPQKRITGQTWTVTNFRRVDGDDTLEQPVRPLHTLSVGDVPAAITELTTHAFVRAANGVTFRSNRYDLPRRTALLDAALGTGKPLVLLMAMEEAAQLARPAGRLEVTLIGRMLFGPLSVLHLPAETGVNGPGPYYQIVGWKWNARMQTHQVTAIEILRENAPVGVKGSWQSDGGDIPFEVDPNVLTDITYDKIPEPFTPKKPGRIGSLTDAEKSDIIKNGPKIKGPLELPILKIRDSSLSDSLPLTADEKARRGTISVFNGNVLLRETRFTGRDILQFIPDPS